MISRAVLGFSGKGDAEFQSFWLISKLDKEKKGETNCHRWRQNFGPAFVQQKQPALKSRLPCLSERPPPLAI